MKKVAIIGECMCELHNAKNNLYKQSFAGDTFNVAVYLKREYSKAKVEYISVVGEDEYSKNMLKFFKKNNLKTNFIDIVNDKSLGLYIIKTTKNDRSFTYWRDNSSAKMLFLTKNTSKILEAIISYDLIYFSAITLAIMNKESRSILFNLLKKARAKGVKIAFDSNYRPKLYKDKKLAKELHTQAIKHCNIFLPSLDDERLLFGKELRSKDIIENSIKNSCHEIIIKNGAKSTIVYHDKNTKKYKVKKISNIIDATSAGDSFNGAYLASRLKGKTITKSVKKGQKLSAKVIMHKGAIIPKRKSK